MNVVPVSHPRLIADIGGTNARFAVQRAPEAELADVAVLPTVDHASLLDAARAYLARLAGLPAPRWCAIGIANPVVGDEVKMTNHHWSFSISALKAALGLERLVVINDFTALALSLPALKPADLRQVGGGSAQAASAMALIGPGTGLGVGGLLPAGHSSILAPLSGEGGHATLAAVNPREEAIIAWLRQRFGHASAERALSGSGLVNLYQACCALAHREPEPLTAADVTARATAGTDALCDQAIAVFFSFLGTTAGNLALTLGAQGGVYIGGGIVPRLGDAIGRSDFRARFESKGRFTGYMKAIPAFVIDSAFPPALLGAARAFDVFD